MSINIQKSKKQMRRGVLEFCVLSIIGQQEVYPSEIITAMKSADLIVVEGTLYPLLTRLKNAGLLTYRWEESNAGPPRKYYSLTATGEIVKNELQKTWQQLVNAVNKTLNKPKDEQSN